VWNTIAKLTRQLFVRTVPRSSCAPMHTQFLRSTLVSKSLWYNTTVDIDEITNRKASVRFHCRIPWNYSDWYNISRSLLMNALPSHTIIPCFTLCRGSNVPNTNSEVTEMLSRKTFSCIVLNHGIKDSKNLWFSDRFYQGNSLSFWQINVAEWDKPR